MQNHTVPNYADLFDDLNSYEVAVQEIPSDTIITVCIALINELNSPEDKFKLQDRIYKSLAKTFDMSDFHRIEKAFAVFKATKNENFSGLIFGRRYLLEMILRELNHFRTIDSLSGKAMEFDFFRAYLLMVQIVNEKDNENIKFQKHEDGFQSSKYELIWKPILPQFEFSERPHIIFETYKLFCFLKHAKLEYYQELKAYLNKNGFVSISQLLTSFNQVNKVIQNDDPDAMLRKLTYLLPNVGIKQEHLIAQTINKVNGITSFSMRSIKEFPLYLQPERGYMVIDPDFYLRKKYFGPFFELYHKTSLKQRLSFNQYCIDVSGALERSLLEPLLTMVVNENANVLHFDDNSKDVPDGYIRIGKMIFLFEYKAYIFNEQLTNYPEVAELKKYIDEKFVLTAKKKKKGITQLRDQINVIIGGGFHFDQASFLREGEENVRIYPIILHHDFMFGMPGVNEYLNEQFEKIVPVHDLRYEIMPVTVMNLSVLLDMALGQRDMIFMEQMLIDYLNYLEQNRMMFAQNQTSSNLMAGHMSFDELFRLHFVQHTATPEGTQKETLEKLLVLSEISFDDYKKEL
ncbi:hypothetical protein DBR43_17080 [Pedobacter sp. KBW06]|uniref:hypothetical protein n=1 Tax=Pedobacter sp. KBW06 TaxID=2153359 RepID=UPI000F59437F|nr:hypothetical protein [Pedobacter sp. KBW06]RQO69772.1 hypothetical protein DBR43_17080 [Pedobacter sp. KBW06]